MVLEQLYSARWIEQKTKYAFLMGFVYYLELVNWFYAVKYVNVSVASTITTPTPVLTMILALIFLGEEIMLYQIIGMIFVFLALYGLIWRGNKNTEKIFDKKDPSTIL